MSSDVHLSFSNGGPATTPLTRTVLFTMAQKL